jgi:hypothetical protein
MGDMKWTELVHDGKWQNLMLVLSRIREFLERINRVSSLATGLYLLLILLLFLIVVLPCILISSELFCQQMHFLLKHKMLQFTHKVSLYMAPTCFGPLGPSSGSMRRILAKVTVFVEIISKNTSLKLLLCSGNMCCVYGVLCGV